MAKFDILENSLNVIIYVEVINRVSSASRNLINWIREKDWVKTKIEIKSM